MSESFENQFMDIQSNLISMCIEVASDVDEVYAWAYITDACTSFNVFFKRRDEFVSLKDLRLSNNTIFTLMSDGTDELDNLIELFEEADRKCPCELKMVYHVGTGKYKADYRYDAYDDEENMDCDDMFLQWKKEISKGS